MATFAPISYTYVPTAPRSKRTDTHGRPAPKPSRVLDKLQHVRSNSIALLPAADSNRDYMPRIQAGTGAFYGGGGGDNLPIIDDLDDPIVLLGDDDSSAFEAEVIGLRAKSAAPDAGLVDSPETAVDSTTPGPPSSPNRWHGIDDLRLAKPGASASDLIRPHNPLSRFSSEPIHDLVYAEGLDTHHARSEVMTSHSDEHGLVCPVLNNFPIDEGEREQQEVEQNEHKGSDENEGLQQEVNDVAAVVTAERVGRRPRSAERQQSLPNSDPSLEPGQDGAGSESRIDVELNNTDSDHDDEALRPMKRKRPSLCSDGPMHKKREHRLQQRSTRQHQPLSHGSRVTAAPSAKGQLPSPAPSASRTSRETLPTLIEITFRPQSSRCFSFTAIVQEGYDGRGVSFSQLTQLIEGIGHVGKIDDFTIKPLQEHSFLLSGFSRHKSLQLMSSSTTVLTLAKTNRIYDDVTQPLRNSKALHIAGAVAQEIDPYARDNGGGLSDSDQDSNSDDGCSSEDEQDRPSTRKNIPWDPLDEQRLLAYMKEDKAWSWIFQQFPNRTPPAVRTRWSMIRHRG